MSNKTCEICGATFSVKPYRAPTARFCSKRCGGVWHAKTRLSGPKPWAIGNKWAAGQGPNRGSFRAGHRPWNADLKGIHLSPETEWKAGRVSEKRLPVGSVTVRVNKRDGKPRAYVKVADPNRWRERSLVVWEQANGPLPRGSVVHHADRDTLNDSLDNLELHTRASHVTEHRAELNAAKAAQKS